MNYPGTKITKMYNPNIHHRRSIRLKDYDFLQCGSYFVTLDLRNKVSLFGNCENGTVALSDIGNIAKELWLLLTEKYSDVALDEFVIMPNHLHGIIVITNDNVEAIHESPLHELPQQQLQQNKIQRRKMLLSKTIGYYKMNYAKRINKLLNTEGSHIWQRNYFERVIRNEDELNRIREYIINNPMKWEFDKENVGVYEMAHGFYSNGNS